MASYSEDKSESDFWRVWFASAVSNVGDGIVLVALPLLAVSLTTDPRVFAFVTVAARLPWLIFGLFAGVIVDRVDRRSAFVVSNILRAMVVTLFTAAIAAGQANLAILLAAVMLGGFGETVSDTAGQAILPSIVRPERLARANGRLYGTQLVLNELVGPPIGAFLFAASSWLPFAIDAMTFALAASAVWTLAPMPPDLKDSQTSVRGDVASAFRFIVRSPILRSLAVLSSLLNLIFTGSFAILLLLLIERLDVSNLEYGFLLGIAAAGGAVGGAKAGAVVERLGLRSTLVLAIVLQAVTWAGIAFSSSIVVSGLMLIIGYASVALIAVSSITLRQQNVPTELLGRVGSAFQVASFGSMPLGAVLYGVSAHRYGLEVPFLSSSIVLILIAIGVQLRFPDHIAVSS